MSNVNIKRAVDNIRASTTVYTPIVEVIVNAIQAIDEAAPKCGKVLVRAIRERQTTLDGSLPDVSGFEIADNGIGFTDEHRNSFDTLYTDRRVSEGGKGFGRFTCLKYFDNVRIESSYQHNSELRTRSFKMGKKLDIIVGEEIDISNASDSGTTVRLSSPLGVSRLEKKLETIAGNLVERLLPYFISEDYICPTITLSETDGSGKIVLNEFVSNEVSGHILEIPASQSRFVLHANDTEENYYVRIFKIYSPGNLKSRISLVAHKREVSGSVLHKYVPEFEEEFYDRVQEGEIDRTRNYIIKAYVFGPYLDRSVSLERGGFEFNMEKDLFFGIGQAEIEQAAARIAQETVGTDIALRQEKKRERVQAYVDEEAPWHKEVLSKLDLTTMSYHPTTEEMEAALQSEKFSQEREIKKEVETLLSEASIEDARESVLEIVSKISGTSKNDLIHYIALRRTILDIFGKSLEVDSAGRYSSEGVVHDIIFPRKGESDVISFEDHNLWIIDERLNFTRYVSSDVALGGGNPERPDLLVYNRRVLFRGDNEAGNPITIFEFKKPQRDDFVNPSSREDPVQQIVRYVNDIQDGKYKTPQGRKIQVTENTPFYGFVVCDVTPKVENWLIREKDFKPMPDRLGWFQWLDNINLYMEVNSWDKVLRDAQMRNKIFFQKLGI